MTLLPIFRRIIAKLGFFLNLRKKIPKTNVLQPFCGQKCLFAGPRTRATPALGHGNWRWLSLVEYNIVGVQTPLLSAQIGGGWCCFLFQAEHFLLKPMDF